MRWTQQMDTEGVAAEEAPLFSPDQPEALRLTFGWRWQLLLHERRRYCNLAKITNSVRSSPPSASPSNCIAQRHSTKGSSLFLSSFYQDQPSSTHLEDFWLIRQSSSQSESHISAMEQKKWNLFLGTLQWEEGRLLFTTCQGEGGGNFSYYDRAKKKQPTNCNLQIFICVESTFPGVYFPSSSFLGLLPLESFTTCLFMAEICPLVLSLPRQILSLLQIPWIRGYVVYALCIFHYSPSRRPFTWRVPKRTRRTKSGCEVLWEN